ncbi:phage virion morphogenesis protein [Rodentibacter pneumotropicus]|uniref:phage virion morphogenesis protein n=1 Tax=Rodentibacter pneumotropicus TaxID=758 RepID=UPI00109C6C31|nr:phage virion morphogenesis protein [Rodentibacter pneumotropicus]THA14545.1 phage virion morphogenesis protein [Rodentibacter pneumotropicus]
MNILMGLKPESIERLKRTLLYMRLTPRIRNQVMQKVLWRLKDNSEKNVSHQQSPTGRPWKPRKKKLKGGVRVNKMLKKRASTLNSKIEQQGERGVLNYTDEKGGEIGAIHQYGLEVPVEQTKKDKKALEKLLAQNDKPATPQQARRLRELGYKIGNGTTKTGKKKYRKARIKDIKNGMSRGQAGLIIRMMEEKQDINIRRGLTSYKMAKRPFLDEDEKRNADIITEELLKGFQKMGYHLQP